MPLIPMNEHKAASFIKDYISRKDYLWKNGIDEFPDEKKSKKGISGKDDDPDDKDAKANPAGVQKKAKIKKKRVRKIILLVTQKRGCNTCLTLALKGQ